MNFGAFIEMIKTGLKKISLGKDAHTPKSKGRKVTKPAKVSMTKKDEKKKDSTAKPASTKEGKEKTSTGNKRKIKR
jgi:hypothetical protein